MLNLNNLLAYKLWSDTTSSSSSQCFKALGQVQLRRSMPEAAQKERPKSSLSISKAAVRDLSRADTQCTKTIPKFCLRLSIRVIWSSANTKAKCFTNKNEVAIFEQNWECTEVSYIKQYWGCSRVSKCFYWRVMTQYNAHMRTLILSWKLLLANIFNKMQTAKADLQMDALCTAYFLIGNFCSPLVLF